MENLVKKCEVCKREFTPSNHSSNRTKYCSDYCCGIASRRKARERKDYQQLESSSA
jgi:hypothetical protein